MAVRYSLLNYMYTLFYYAHTQGDTIMRALAWEFPEDATLAGTFTQFMLGPSLLITPVLVPNVDTVNGVFPGVSDGTIWYDWYSLQAVDVEPYENKTLNAPLEHINVHVRGGSILPLQEPRYTTSEVRNSPFSLLVALDKNGEASGSLYLDDGESLVPPETKLVKFNYASGTLSTTVNGTYSASPGLANVTIVGASGLPKNMSMHIGHQQCNTSAVPLDYADGILRIRGLESFTSRGAWEGQMQMSMHW